MEHDCGIGVFDRLLQHLAVRLEDGDPWRFGLMQHPAHRLLDGSAVDRSLDPGEESELPLHIQLAGFVSQPDVELPRRQRKRPVIAFHPTSLASLRTITRNE
ncbi:hypothetical protein MPRG_41350 [Mycobacterium paragordonae]|uniref:Uncharacterized protein n=1 Tax=Mycobacterium paragordonae TaxID=1389713 RepID=A0ABQ1C9C5_9MYCO|nr:hypothetical protein MPRG_41350 [Mycobacterium paragordonae]